MSPVPSSPTSDLAWDAWRYASDELTAAERETFEARLAESVDACEALADAVLLRQALLAAGSSSRAVAVAAPALQGRRSAGWIATLVAASLLVLVGTTVSRLRPQLAESLDAGAEADAALAGGEQSSVFSEDEELVDLWVALKQESESDSSAATVLDEGGDVVAPDADDVPDWMFAALEEADDEEGAL
jgi:ferric-dicitrate binding protein FerR (iron transport regulator)